MLIIFHSIFDIGKLEYKLVYVQESGTSCYNSFDFYSRYIVVCLNPSLKALCFPYCITPLVVWQVSNQSCFCFFPQIIVIWTAEHPPPPTRQWPFIGGRTDLPIKVLHQPQARVSERFLQNRWIRTNAILVRTAAILKLRYQSQSKHSSSRKIFWTTYTHRQKI